MTIRMRQTRQGQWLLPVRVTPHASRDEILKPNIEDEALHIKVRAIPDKGEANTAVTRLLAEVLGLGKKHVSVHHGQTARQKQLAIIFDGSGKELIACLAAGIPADPACFACQD